MENNLVKKQPTFSVVIQSDMYKKLINNIKFFIIYPTS